MRSSPRCAGARSTARAEPAHPPLLRAVSRISAAEPRLRRDCLRRRVRWAREIGPVRGGPQPSLRRPRVRDPGADAPGRRCSGYRSSRAGSMPAGSPTRRCRGRRRSRQRRSGGHRHVHAVRRGLRTPSARSGAIRSSRWGSGLLLRQRAREPDCRWSTYLCKRSGHRRSNPAAVRQATPRLQPRRRETIQERRLVVAHLVSSRGFARVRGVECGSASQPGQDVLTLGIGLGRMPAGLDPSTQALTVALRDDDEVYRVNHPGRTLRTVRPVGRSGTTPRGASVAFGPPAPAARSPERPLPAAHGPPGLSAADRVDHFIEVSLRAAPPPVTTTPSGTSTGSPRH